MRVPWTARRSNQSILKEISLEYSLEGLMLKLQYFGYLMPRADLLGKTLMMGKIGGRRRRGRQRMRWWDGFIDSVDMSLSKLWEIVEDWEAWHAAMRLQRVGHDLATERQLPVGRPNLGSGLGGARRAPPPLPSPSCHIYREGLQSRLPLLVHLLPGAGGRGGAGVGEG